MTSANITRAEAADRSAAISVTSYAVDLDLTTSDTTFRSRTTVTFTAEPGMDSWIDLIAPQVNEVVLNGAAMDTARNTTGRASR